MGSGSASKTRLIIEALLRSQPELLFMPVDISATALESSSRILLAVVSATAIEAYAADYFAGLAELGKKPRAAPWRFSSVQTSATSISTKRCVSCARCAACLKRRRCCWAPI